MPSEREAVVTAIQSSKNLGVAAHKLGASRRTLQNRMRFYGLPRGQSGRPKESLPKRGGGGVPVLSATGWVLFGAVASAAAFLFFAARWRTQKPSTPVVGAVSSPSVQLRGIDVFAAR